jgi:hypothetical protein
MLLEKILAFFGAQKFARKISSKKSFVRSDRKIFQEFF